MYAVFEDGARQYRVQEGDVVQVDYRAAEIGSSVEFPRVLLVQNEPDVRIGQPLVAGARVVGEVIDLPTTKTVIQKFRKRKNYRRLRGHTQPFVQVRITQIAV